jgi:hypothetical protein
MMGLKMLIILLDIRDNRFSDLFHEYVALFVGHESAAPYVLRGMVFEFSGLSSSGVSMYFQIDWVLNIVFGCN